MNLIQTMTVDVTTLKCVLIRVLPAALIMGYLGHLTGAILDNPRGRKK